MRTLRYGCVGDDVGYLQYLIGAEVDRHFEHETEKKLKKKQKELGLDDDGSCGPLTQKALHMSEFMVFVFDPKVDKLWVAGTPYGAASYPLHTLGWWAKEEGAEIAFNSHTQGSPDIRCFLPQIRRFHHCSRDCVSIIQKF